jgi:hypothetical protein
MSDVMAAFMRDSNIRWGELVGGMLIIGGSIALVISFWSQIAHHSFVQFALFTGVTTAMLGLGLYAEHRWKLPTTSRGILLIATLLVPLNFLAFAALSHGAKPTAIETAIEIGALALFGFLVWRAAAVLMPYWPRLLVIGVVGPSASLVLVQRLGIRQSVGANLLLGAIPVLIYCAVVAVMLARAGRWKHVRAHVIEAIFVLLGVATFATVASVGLLVFRSASPWEVAHELSPLLSVGTAPMLAVGLLIWSRVQDRKLARYRVSGTAIAIGAAMILVGAIVLAWPDPAYLLPLAIADFIILSVIAVLFEIPVAHWIALPCALVGYLTASAVLRGQIGWITPRQKMLEAILDPQGGGALVGLFAIFAAAAWTFRRLARNADAWAYRRIALVVALISLALVSQTAFDPARAIPTAALVYALYAAAAFFAAISMGWTATSWAACALVLATFVQAILTRTHVHHPWTIGLLTGATALALAELLIRPNQSLRTSLSNSLKWTASLAAAAAITLLAPSASLATANIVGAEILWAAALWFLIALVESSEPVFIVAQLALGAGIAISVVGRLTTHAWFHDTQIPLLHPWTLQAIGVALAAIPLLAAIARPLLPSRWPIARWLSSPWSVDRSLAFVLAAGLTILICIGTFDAIRFEFAISTAKRTPAHLATRLSSYGSWLLLAELTLTFAIWTARRVEPRTLLLVLAVTLLACPLIAMRSAESGSAASLLRWLLAAAGLAGSTLLWSRHKLRAPSQTAIEIRITADFRALLVAMCAVPVLALSVYLATLTLGGHHVLGPLPGTFFAKLGNSASYRIPLLLVSLTFLGHAIRERSGAWVAASTGVANLTVTLAYALSVTTSGSLWTDTDSLRLLQLNVLVLAAFALGWIGVIRVFQRRAATPLPRHPPQVLVALVMLASITIAIPLVGEAGWLWLSPSYAQSMTAMSDPLGWIAVIASLTAVALLYGLFSPGVLGVTSAILAMTIAFSAAHYDPTQWLSFHVLMCTVLAAAGIILATGIWRGTRDIRIVKPDVAPTAQPATDNVSHLLALEYRHEERAPESEPVIHPIRYAYVNWIAAFSVWLVLLAMRATLSDPQRPWWSTACTLTLSLLWVAVACWMRSGSLLYVGGLLPNLAATFWWFEKPWVPSHDLADLLCGNATVLAVSGLAGLVLHIQLFRFYRPDKPSPLPRFHRFALNVVTLGMVLFGISAVFDSLGFSAGAAAPITALPALLAGAALALATAADETGIALPQLYAIGLSAVAIIIQLLHPAPSHVEWAYQIGLCIFIILTGLLYSIRTPASELLKSIGLPPTVGPNGLDFIRYSTAVLATIAVCLAIRVNFLVPQLDLRLLAATAALLQLLALAVMADEPRLTQLRQFCALLSVGAIAAWVWAWMSPWSDPVARSAAALFAVTTSLCAGGILTVTLRRNQKSSAWLEAIKKTAHVVVALWISAGLALIAFEILATLHHQRAILSAPWVILIIAIFLAGSAASVLRALRKDESDTLGIPFNQRGLYVYAAEALLAVTFLHLRLTEPWLFKGFFVQYWPLIVMAIAFTGVALGEFLQRRRLPVLSQPLTRTGIFLPLLPALAFSMLPSRVDYAGLLFLVGFFYAVMSALRRSFVLGVAAALAANGALWSLLYRYPDLRFFIHPQLWLIPAAASVLIAAQLNRDRLTAAQLRVIRYACLTVVYVSSTSDIFLNGVRDHPFLPLVLALLSVTGVLIGILFRLRAFLFLGTSFLAVSIITMIHFASVNLHWTWLWYVAVIALGAALLTLFALFEKKKTEMLSLVDGLKSWH